MIELDVILMYPAAALTASTVILPSGFSAEALDYLFGTEHLPKPATSMPDLMLLDLKLPKLDAFELLMRLRTDNRTKHLPVVVLTASNEDEIRTKAYRFGATSFVRKPTHLRTNFSGGIGVYADRSRRRHPGYREIEWSPMLVRAHRAKTELSPNDLDI